MTDPLRDFIDGIEREVAERYVSTGYSDSYVAFLDIMGMRELVGRPYADLRGIFNAAEAGKALYSRITVPGGHSFVSEDHLKMTIMSDSLVLSIDNMIDQAFSKLVGFSSYLINRLVHLEPPVFVRGGLIRGEIFQDGATVFGPGLVEAHKLEDERANSMRCIVSPEFATDPTVERYLTSKGCALVVDPTDDLKFIDFARELDRERLGTVVAQVLQSDAADDVKKKYEWLRRYLDSWPDV